MNKIGSKVSDKNKFPSLLEFLLEQKRIIQYDSVDLRETGSTGAAAHHIDVLDINGTSDNKLKIKQQKCVIHGTTSHFIGDCKSFLALNPDEKIKVVKENKLFYSCLRTGHRSSQCRLRNQCPEGCERYHHETLHQAYVEGVSFHTEGQVQKLSDEDCGACLLQLMEIKSGTPHGIPLIVSWDGGAIISLITFQRATMLNLHE